MSTVRNAKMIDGALPAAAAQTTLAEVIHHWGSAYLISLGAGGFVAVRRDGKGVPLAAPSPGALWDLITVDYADEPVSHEFDPPAREPRDVVPLVPRGAR